MHTRPVESVTCPFCRRQFEIDPALGAVPYKCPHCGEQSSITILQQSFFHLLAPVVHQEALAAETEQLRRFSIGYTYQSCGVWQVASGTLVNIGDKFLIATAAHTIPLKTTRINFAPKTPGGRMERKPIVQRLAKSDRTDVGLIEVEPNAPQLIGSEAIPLVRIADLSWGREGDLACLFGYGIRDTGLHSYCIECEPTAYRFWPSIAPTLGRIDDEGGLSESVHCLVYYNPGLMDGMGPHTTIETVRNHTPFGMSGAGLWQRGTLTRPDQLWSPDSLCLFAIQSRWPRRGQFLKAIQVIHWLRLVADTYPELHCQLRQQFPRTDTPYDNERD